MTKYHITKSGKPDKCDAIMRACPLGGDDAHYPTAEIAAQKYEEKMTVQLFEGSESKKLGVRDLQKLAKITTNPNLQLLVAKEGNEAAIKNLARNEAATTAAIEAAYVRNLSEAANKELATHLHADLSIMHPEHVAYALVSSNDAISPKGRLHYKKMNEVLQADWIGDREIESYDRQYAKDNGKTRSRSYLALSNVNNRISEDLAVRMSAHRAGDALEAFKADRIPAHRFPELGSNVAISLNKNPKTIHAAMNYAADGTNDLTEGQRYGILKDVLQNKHTSTKTLQDHVLMSNENFHKALYAHPKVTDTAKKHLERVSPAIQSLKRIETAVGHDRTRGDLVKELKLSGNSISTQRGYHSTMFKLDKDKIESYGLTKDDVEELFSTSNTRGVFQYNEETGVFGGAFDSSD